MFKKKDLDGLTLIEIVVTLSILLIILIPILSVTTISVYNAQFARNQSLATKYAQEGMENIRALRDSSWAEFWNDVTGEEICFPGVKPDPTPISCSSLSCSKIGNIFTRCLKMEAQGENEARVTVTVSWTQGTKTHQSKLISNFTKWQHPKTTSTP